MLARLLIIPSTVLCVLAIGYVVFTTGNQPRSYSNPSGSMAPTIVPGEMIFASGGFYPSHTPIPGDIVLFNVPREGELTTFIKRVVAGPGDRVKIERGRLYLNGVLVERSPLPPDPTADDLVYRETLPNGRSYEIAEISDGESRGRHPGNPGRTRALFRPRRQSRPIQRQPLSAIRHGPPGRDRRQGLDHLDEP